MMGVPNVIVAMIFKIKSVTPILMAVLNIILVEVVKFVKVDLNCMIINVILI